MAVGACAVAGYTADTLGHREVLIWIVAAAEIALLALIGFGGLMQEESGRKPWGIVWFPLAFLVLLLITESAEMIGFMMAILAVCDPAATIVGKLFTPTKKISDLLDVGLLGHEDEGIRPQVMQDRSASDSIFPDGRPHPRWQYNLTGDPKSYVGSAAFFVAYLLLVVLVPTSYYYGADATVGSPEYLHQFYPLLSILCFGIILTAGEALGSKGLDNLIVPLLAAVLMNIHYYRHHNSEHILLAGAIVTGCGFTYLTVKRGSLSSGGAITASLLGTLIVYAAGVKWLLPLLLFFGSSIVIGKLFPTQTLAGDAKQKQPRDATQVLANGGIFLLLALTYAPEDYFSSLWKEILPYPFLLLIAAAVATADTWSSELGQYFRRPTWDLLRWRRVPTGLSGGVSWPGTLGGLGAAALIASLGFWFLPKPSITLILKITAFGFLGMLIDSALGSLLQATYRDPLSGALSDVCPEGGTLHSGFSWMTNDLVNFLAIGLTVILAAFFC